MTEPEWLTCTDTYPMLDHIRDSASDRKFRLFAVACCRLIWHLLHDPRSQDAVLTAEIHADRVETGETLTRVHLAAWEVDNDRLDREHYAAVAAARATWRSDGFGGAYHAKLVSYDVGYVSEGTGAVMCGILREIVGNPFRLVSVHPGWQSRNGGAVVRLAQVAYGERALPSGEMDAARLAVLADALEEAGCMDADLLGHLRGPGPHVRGCWAVDLLLGKE